MTLLEGLLWLTLNVYHEARSEPLVGQVAVAFVTLNRAGRLRGCIGSLVPVATMFQSVHDNAIHAALNDSRFRPVTVDELSSVDRLRAHDVDGRAVHVGLDEWFTPRGTHVPQVWGRFLLTLLDLVGVDIVDAELALQRDAGRGYDAFATQFVGHHRPECGDVDRLAARLEREVRREFREESCR